MQSLQKNNCNKFISSVITAKNQAIAKMRKRRSAMGLEIHLDLMGNNLRDWDKQQLLLAKLALLQEVRQLLLKCPFYHNEI